MAKSLVNQGATLLYKCRRCGEVKEDWHVPDGLTAVICITGNSKIPKEWGDFVQPGLLGTHICDDSSCGVTDLIGCEFDDKRSGG